MNSKYMDKYCFNRGYERYDPYITPYDILKLRESEIEKTLEYEKKRKTWTYAFYYTTTKEHVTEKELYQHLKKKYENEKEKESEEKEVPQKVDPIVAHVTQKEEEEEIPMRLLLAKLAKRDVYVFLRVPKGSDADTMRKLVLMATANAQNDKFTVMVDDLEVVYNQAYQDMKWDKDGYEVVYPYGK